jgi:phospholipase/lecithinase/hemolysin
MALEISTVNLNRGHFMLHKIGTAFLALLLTSGAYAAPFTNIVVFGDSLSDSGNSPNSTYTLTSAAGLPFPPAPFYVNGRFSNGPTSAEVAAQLSGRPTIDYAQGGATTGSRYGAPFAANYGVGANINNNRCVPSNLTCSANVPTVLSGIADQVASYLANPHPSIASTLFMLQGGGNDFFAALSTGNNAFIANIVPNLGGMVGALLAGGANQVMVMNMPDLSRTPFGAGSTTIHDAVVAVNSGISNFIWSNPNVIAFDSYSVLNDILDHPGAYGVVNTTVPCQNAIAAFNGGVSNACPDSGYKFAFWDDVHPTAYIHGIVGQKIALAAGIPTPSAIWLLAIGFGGLLFNRRRAAQFIS